MTTWIYSDSYNSDSTVYPYTTTILTPGVGDVIEIDAGERLTVGGVDPGYYTDGQEFWGVSPELGVGDQLEPNPIPEPPRPKDQEIRRGCLKVKKKPRAQDWLT